MSSVGSPQCSQGRPGTDSMMPKPGVPQFGQRVASREASSSASRQSPASAWGSGGPAYRFPPDDACVREVIGRRKGACQRFRRHEPLRDRLTGRPRMRTHNQGMTGKQCLGRELFELFATGERSGSDSWSVHSVRRRVAESRGGDPGNTGLRCRTANGNLGMRTKAPLTGQSKVSARASSPHSHLRRAHSRGVESRSTSPENVPRRSVSASCSTKRTPPVLKKRGSNGQRLRVLRRQDDGVTQ